MGWFSWFSEWTQEDSLYENHPFLRRYHNMVLGTSPKHDGARCRYTYWPPGRYISRLVVWVCPRIQKLERCESLEVWFWLVDERCLPVWDKDRNDVHVIEKFIWPLCNMWILQPSQFITPWDIVEAANYESEIPFLILRSSEWGLDGHIASLFPHHPGLDIQGTRYIDVIDSPKPPSRRISLSVSGVQIPFTCLLLLVSQKKRSSSELLGWYGGCSWLSCRNCSNQKLSSI